MQRSTPNASDKTSTPPTPTSTSSAGNDNLSNAEKRTYEKIESRVHYINTLLEGDDDDWNRLFRDFVIRRLSVNALRELFEHPRQPRFKKRKLNPLVEQPSIGSSSKSGKKGNTGHPVQAGQPSRPVNHGKERCTASLQSTNATTLSFPQSVHYAVSLNPHITQFVGQPSQAPMQTPIQYQNVAVPQQNPGQVNLAFNRQFDCLQTAFERQLHFQSHSAPNMSAQLNSGLHPMYVGLQQNAATTQASHAIENSGIPAVTNVQPAPVYNDLMSCYAHGKPGLSDGSKVAMPIKRLSQMDAREVLQSAKRPRTDS